MDKAKRKELVEKMRELRKTERTKRTFRGGRRIKVTLQ